MKVNDGQSKSLFIEHETEKKKMKSTMVKEGGYLIIYEKLVQTKSTKVKVGGY